MNNRQNGRRRGRGGQQTRSGQPGGPNNGSRVDNRARGNAAQLLEKYKNLARDAQMSGDRVNTEYYLQFADHYFRVLNENRARFEEQRPQRPDYRDEFGDEDGGDTAQSRAEGGDNGWDDGEGDVQPQQRSYAPRAERAERPDRVERAANGREAGEGRRERGRRNGTVAPAPLVESDADGQNEAAGFAPDFMSQRIAAPAPDAAPPQLAEDVAEAAIEPAVEKAPKPRRPRKPRAEAVVEA
ncbi:DUF4167 domain-containing protein [Sphingomonas sp.]|uniref:DUF4167 domain-containing protein n=1 Tax=Sphingomonas sp. TaxID=28214 RepID=UPI003B3AF296